MCEVIINYSKHLPLFFFQENFFAEIERDIAAIFM